MKKIFSLFLVSLMLSQFLNAQNETKVSSRLKEMNEDTALYLKQEIIDQKSSYTGKRLDSLLRDLPASIYQYYNGDNPKNRFLCPGTSFSFYSVSEILNRTSQKKNPLIIFITWDSPLDINELSALGLAKIFGGKWTQVAYNYFKSKIIGNVEMVKSDF